jgi:hypothetical protein
MTALSVNLPEDKHRCLETLAKRREAPWSPMIDELMTKKGVKDRSSTQVIHPLHIKPGA